MSSIKKILQTAFWCGLCIGAMYLAVYFVEIYKNDHNTHMERLNYSKMISDYDKLWELIYAEAPFIPAALEESGTDPDELRRSFRKKINITTTPEEFMELVMGLEPAMNYTGHFRRLREADIVDNLLEIELYSLKNYRVKLDMFNRKSAESLAWLPAEDWVMSRQAVPAELPEEAEKVLFGDWGFGQILEVDTAYVRFTALDGEQDLRGLKEFYKSVNDCDNLIIDLRNTGGMDGGGWIKGIVEPLAHRPFEYRTLTAYSNGEYAKRFYLETYSWVAESEAEVSEGERPGLADTLSIWGDTDYILTAADYLYENTDPATAYGGRIWVLTNDGTFGAADTFANFCKYSGFGVLVGTATGGNGIWLNPEKYFEYGFQLPDSGLTFSFAPSMGINLDGTSNITRGDTPDYPTDGDALEHVTELIRSGR